MNYNEWKKSFDLELQLGVGFTLSKFMTVALESYIKSLYSLHPNNPFLALRSIDFDDVKYDSLFKG